MLIINTVYFPVSPCSCKAWFMLTAVLPDWQLLQGGQGKRVCPHAGRKPRLSHPLSTVQRAQTVGRRKHTSRESRFSRRALRKSCAVATCLRTAWPMGIRRLMIRRGNAKWCYLLARNLDDKKVLFQRWRGSWGPYFICTQLYLQVWEVLAWPPRCISVRFFCSTPRNPAG